MTAEELVALIEEKVLVVLEKQKEEAKDDPPSDVKNEKIEKLIADIAEYKATVKVLEEQLKRPVNVKLDAGEDGDDGDAPPPVHKFKGVEHFIYDVFKAGSAGRDESDELRDWRKYVEKATEKVAGTPTQSAGEAEGGGYAIPIEYAREAWIRQTEMSAIYQNALKLPMTTPTLRIPVLFGYDESSHTVYGNVQWLWKAELKEYEAKDIELEMIELNLQKLTGLSYLSDEIMKFANPAIEPMVKRAFDVGLNRAISRACLRGTGVGQPAGMLDADCTIEISEEDGQPDDTFVLENMLNMQARLYSVDENPAGFWYANRQLIPQMATMSLPVGTGGSAMFLVSGVQDKPQYSLMGLPVRFSTAMSAIGDSGDIMLIDPSQYIIGEYAGGVEQVSSIHVQFLYGQTALRFTFWMAGQPGWRTYFTPEYGDTMSPFIKLEAR